MKLKSYISMLIFVLLIFPSIVNALTYNGDTVYINDSKAFVSATPHTVEGITPIELEFQAKTYTGNVNLLFGYNGEYLKPFKLERFNPHQECYNTTSGLNNETEEEICNTVNWTQVTSQVGDFNYINYDLDGKTDWYYRTNYPVIAGQNYKFRIWIKAPYLDFGKTQTEQYPDYDGKWDFAIYPSSYGTNLGQAINDGNLFLLDPTVDLVTGLEAYYMFDTNADDSISGYDGTVTGAVLTTGDGGIDDEGYSFDGNDYIRIGNNSNLRPLKDYSVCAWINTNYETTSFIFAGGMDFNSGQYGGYYLQLLSTGYVRFGKSVTGSTLVSVTSTTVVDDSNYHFVCGIVNADGTLEMWLDDTLEDTDANTADTHYNKLYQQWGAWFEESTNDYAKQPFSGVIDEGMIYLKALNDTEIEALYASGSGYFYPFATISPTFTIQANNTFNSTLLNVFNATVDGDFFSTTNGTINTDLQQNSTILHNITIRAEDHFVLDLTGVNVSSNYVGQLYQSEIDYACYEIVTQNLLSCDESGTYNFNAGTYEIQANVTGYTSVTQNITVNALDNKTFNFEGFYNGTLNLTINASYGTDILLTNYGVTIQTTNFTQNYTCTDVHCYIPLVNNLNYSLQITKNDYTTIYPNITNFNNSLSYKYTMIALGSYLGFSAKTYGIYADPLKTESFNATSIIIPLSTMPTGEIKIKFNYDGNNYSQFFEFYNDGNSEYSIEKEIELFSSIDTELYFKIVDVNNVPLERATIKLYSVTPSTPQNFTNNFRGQRITESDGTALLKLNSADSIILIVSKDGYDTQYKTVYTDDYIQIDKSDATIITLYNNPEYNYTYTMFGDRTYDLNTTQIRFCVYAPTENNLYYKTTKNQALHNSMGDQGQYGTFCKTLEAGTDFDVVNSAFNLTTYKYKNLVYYEIDTYTFNNVEDTNTINTFSFTGVGGKIFSILLFIGLLLISVIARTKFNSTTAGFTIYMTGLIVLGIVNNAFMWSMITAGIYFATKNLYKVINK